MKRSIFSNLCANARAVNAAIFLCLIAVSTVAQSAPTRVTNGLIGEYKLDSWSQWFPDQTGNSSGLVNWHAYASVGDVAPSVLRTRGWSSNGVFLDGNQWLTVKPTFGTSPVTSPFNFGTGNFTLTAWIKPWSVGGIRTIIDNRGSNGYGFMFYIYNGTLRLKLIDQNGSATYATDPLLNADNVWRHVAVVAFRKEKVAYFLIDGEQKKVVALPAAASIDNDTLEWYIGKNKIFASQNFWGVIDHVYIYNRGLQINEAQTFTTPGVPSYEPGYWNDNSTTRNNNNCYNYAMNIRRSSFAQPGQAGGFNKPFALHCSDIHQGLVADGLVPISSPAQAQRGKGVVAMVTDAVGFYHLYRRDANGYWSHKDGNSPATNLDASGNLITNPATANRGNYINFCGYYSIWTDSIQGQGHEHISN